MNREQKIQLLKKIAAGKATKKDIQGSVKPDASTLTVEELKIVLGLRKKHEQGIPFTDEEQERIKYLNQALINRPPECGWYPKIKKWLTEGKSLKEIAREMSVPWQDTEVVKKVIEYYEKHGL